MSLRPSITKGKPTIINSLAMGSENAEMIRGLEADMVRHQDKINDMEDFVQECEEATLPICMRVPYTPTLLEKELHERAHIPFRNWCPFCEAGKAKGHPHQGKKM